MITRTKERSDSYSSNPSLTPRTTDDMKEIFSNLDFRQLLYQAPEGLLVATDCIPADIRLFEDFLRSEDNRTFPVHVKISLVDGNLYIKSVPGWVHDCAANELALQFSSGITGRIGRGDALKEFRSPTHKIGENYFQADVTIARWGRTCANFFGEIRSNVGDTATVIHQGRRNISCPNARYCLCIDILGFIVGNIQNKQVRILAHLFEKNRNNDWAPISITSFGNYDPGNSFFNQNGVIHHLFNTHYPGYIGVDSNGHHVVGAGVVAGNLGQIELKGIGLDPAAPVCVDEAQSLQYYRLAMRHDYLFEGDGGLGVIDNTRLTAAQQAALQAEAYINLYPIQQGVRSGFFRDGTFALPKDPDCF